MEQHTVRSYDRELNLLNQYVFEMFSLVKDMFGFAKDTIVQNNKSLVEVAEQTDAKINKIDKQVEKMATNLLALRQPMAIDLRQIVSSLRVAVIMERMGDLAKHACVRISVIEDLQLDMEALSKIKNMSEIILSMIDDTIAFYQQKNNLLAREVYERDKDVDIIYAELMKYLEKKIQEKGTDVSATLQVIFAVKNFERFADYIIKLVLIAHYVITGEMEFERE